MKMFCIIYLLLIAITAPIFSQKEYDLPGWEKLQDKLYLENDGKIVFIYQFIHLTPNKTDSYYKSWAYDKFMAKLDELYSSGKIEKIPARDTYEKRKAIENKFKVTFKRKTIASEKEFKEIMTKGVNTDLPARYFKGLPVDWSVTKIEYQAVIKKLNQPLPAWTKNGETAFLVKRESSPVPSATFEVVFKVIKNKSGEIIRKSDYNCDIAMKTIAASQGFKLVDGCGNKLIDEFIVNQGSQTEVWQKFWFRYCISQ